MKHPDDILGRELYPGEVDPTLCTAVAALIECRMPGSCILRSEVARFGDMRSAELALAELRANARGDVWYELQAIRPSGGRRA